MNDDHSGARLRNISFTPGSVPSAELWDTRALASFGCWLPFQLPVPLLTTKAAHRSNDSMLPHVWFLFRATKHSTICSNTPVVTHMWKFRTWHGPSMPNILTHAACLLLCYAMFGTKVAIKWKFCKSMLLISWIYHPCICFIVNFFSDLTILKSTSYLNLPEKQQLSSDFSSPLKVSMKCKLHFLSNCDVYPSEIASWTRKKI